MDVTIIADQGTHLLIGWGNRFAVAERRNNHLYNCHDGKRDGIPLDDLQDISTILDESNWTDKAAAQATFGEIVTRGTEIAEHMR